jgi:hypothetical protein
MGPPGGIPDRGTFGGSLFSGGTLTDSNIVPSPEFTVTQEQMLLHSPKGLRSPS